MKEFKFIFCCCLLSLILFSGCTSRREDSSLRDTTETTGKSVDSVAAYSVQHARGFKIDYFKNYKLISVKDPWDSKGKVNRYVLYRSDSLRPAGYEDAQYIKVPVKNFIILSSLYAAYSDKLNLNNQLIGISEFRLINTQSILNLISKGQIQEVGAGGSLNIEKIIELSPGLVITYGTGDPALDTHPKLMEAGLKVAVNAEQMETTPLGRAEWIRFMAAFFDKEKEADSVFRNIENRYHKMKEIARSAKSSPTVFTGIKYGDAWYMPGGESYAANLFKDAHAGYLWAESPKRGSIPLSFEAVYEKAASADYWINVSDWSTKQDILKNDPRYGGFKAFKTGTIYNNNKRVNRYGGNDYWESGLLNPDLVLGDLIKILHPELLPEYEFVYYKKIKDEQEK
ncbi:MAG: ABC transporter substrate-binding protein [Cytophagaceae bacterium]